MEPSIESNVGARANVDEPLGPRSTVEQRLGQIGRTLKNVDLRGRVIDNPFAAISIAAGVGALVGLVRPRPQPSRSLSGALVGALGALAFRMLREAALYQLGQVAKNYVGHRHDGSERARPDAVRYTPA